MSRGGEKNEKKISRRRKGTQRIVFFLASFTPCERKRPLKLVFFQHNTLSLENNSIAYSKVSVIDITIAQNDVKSVIATF